MKREITSVLAAAALLWLGRPVLGNPPIILEPEHDAATPQAARRVSIHFDEAPLSKVVQAFAKHAKVRIIYPFAKSRGTATVNIDDVEWQPALEAILEMHHCSLIELAPDIFVVTEIPKLELRIQPQAAQGAKAEDDLTDTLVKAVREVARAYMAYLAEPQTAKQLAQFDKNYFDALVGSGFTADQAFKLLIRRSPPLFQNQYTGGE